VVFIAALILARFIPNAEVSEESIDHYVVEAKIVSDQLAGKTVLDAGLRSLDDFYLVEVIRGERKISPVVPETLLQLGDRLTFVGDVRRLERLAAIDGLELFAETLGFDLSALTEVMVRPGSAVLGATVRDSEFRSRFDAAIVGIKRHGHYLSGKLGAMKLQAGDMLTLATGPDFKKRRNISRNFTLFNNIEVSKKLSLLQEVITVFGLVMAVLSSIVLNVPLLTAVAVYLGALFLSETISLNELRHKLQLDVLVIVASALCIASAFVTTGLSGNVSVFAQGWLSGFGPMMAVVMVYLVTLVVTEIITNNAAAALMLPVAVAVAGGLGVELMPFVMAVAFGASASFINPFGYQTNLIAFNSGDYSIKHFIYCGLPVSIVYSIAVLSMIFVVYPVG
jgi:di/tricarboxylate transporter